MSNSLQIIGKQNFMGKDIPVVLGGFGPDRKCISDKTIAEIHGMNTFDVRRRIADNKKRFFDGVDCIDMIERLRPTHTLGQRIGENDMLELLASLGYAKQSITQAEHIYILSERGYAKLIKIMDSDTAWEVHDRLMDEYFSMREELYGGSRREPPKDFSSALRMLADEVEKTAALEAENQRKQKMIEEQKPMVEFAEKVGNSKDLITMSQMAKLVHDENIPLGRNKLLRWLRDKKILRENNEPYQQYVSSGLFDVKEVAKETTYGHKIFPVTLVTGKGQMYIVEKLRKEYAAG